MGRVKSGVTLCAIWHLHRSEVYAISRNMEEADFEKKSQIVPRAETPSISGQLLQLTEGSSKPGSWKVRKPLATCTADRQRTELFRRAGHPWHGSWLTRSQTQWVHDMILHSPPTFFMHAGRAALTACLLISLQSWVGAWNSHPLYSISFFFWIRIMQKIWFLGPIHIFLPKSWDNPEWIVEAYPSMYSAASDASVGRLCWLAAGGREAWNCWNAPPKSPADSHWKMCLWSTARERVGRRAFLFHRAFCKKPHCFQGLDL